jgi:hypothetical protein
MNENLQSEVKEYKSKINSNEGKNICVFMITFLCIFINVFICI